MSSEELGAKVASLKAPERAPEARSAAPKYVELRIRSQKGNEVKFRANVTKPMKDWMAKYCSSFNLKESEVRFMFGDVQLRPGDTGKQLAMEGSVLIDAKTEPNL